MYSKDTQILSDWGIQGKLRTAPRIESVNWVAPNAPTIKVNTDGASRVGLTTIRVTGLSVRQSLKPLNWQPLRDCLTFRLKHTLKQQSRLLDHHSCHGP
ncbi:hypothetical protein IFM89_002184 [Coptis chinensis]|uniref:Uncharacterized protein n=1 Tax=Coptis chinensis TaxID=261450 RepID=A0A835I9S0_9MAGN|nr:hypothetical protein IFM89_002184 [Coptis chinensis]